MALEYNVSGKSFFLFALLFPSFKWLLLTTGILWVITVLLQSLTLSSHGFLFYVSFFLLRTPIIQFRVHSNPLMTSS